MQTIIHDLSSLTFRWNATHTAFSAFTRAGELLARIECPATISVEEAIFEVCDAALAQSRLKRLDDSGSRGLLKLALYNPYTGQISLGATPRTLVFGDSQALAIPATGLQAEVTEECMWVEDRVLARIDPSYKNALSSIIKHTQEVAL